MTSIVVLGLVWLKRHCVTVLCFFFLARYFPDWLFSCHWYRTLCFPTLLCQTLPNRKWGWPLTLVSWSQLCCAFNLRDVDLSLQCCWRQIVSMCCMVSCPCSQFGLYYLCCMVPPIIVSNLVCTSCVVWWVPLVSNSVCASCVAWRPPHVRNVVCTVCDAWCPPILVSKFVCISCVAWWGDPC